MQTELADKIVIVTGATANIGRAIVLAFAREGARLAMIGRDRGKGAEISALACADGAAQALFIAADMTDKRDVDAMVAQVATQLGPVDVLVNNVGGNTGFFTCFADSNPQDWQADIDLNLKSTLLCTHAALPHMLARGSGRIINIGSTAGIAGDYMLGVYSAAKGAVHAFTRALALEVGEHGITVNCVAPYSTLPEDPAHTSSGSRFTPDGLFARDPALAVAKLGTKLLRNTVLQRQAAKPSEIAAGVVYLASEAAAFVTGQVHAIDGGALL